MAAIVDIGFEWPVPVAGYEFVERPPEKVERRPADKVEHPGMRTFEGKSAFGAEAGGFYLVPKGNEMRRQQPLLVRDNLYLLFASLDGTPKACAEFATSWGALGLHQAKGGEESVAVWRDAIHEMHSAISFWRKDPALFMPKAPWKVGGTVDVYLGPVGADGAARLSLRPRSLWTGLWIQFAQAAASGLAIKDCEHCGVWFEAGGRGGTSRRADAKFCSHRCHVAHKTAKRRES